MRVITEIQRKAAMAAIALGILIGAFGAVRTGSIFIALGTGVIALSQWAVATGRRRIIECYFPLALAGVLFALALALPKGL